MAKTFLTAFRVLLIGLLLHVTAKAQDLILSGSVKDKVTNLPIESALLEVLGGVERYSTLTNTSGFWTCAVKLPTSGVQEKSGLPNSLSLYQNYPNPFNPSTKISFGTTKAGYIRISVHNVIGQQVDSRTFFLQPGGYSIEWLGGASSGVYFYSVEGNGSKLTRKMLQLDGRGISKLGDLVRFSHSAETVRLSKSTGYLTVIASKFRYDTDTSVIAAVNNAEVDFSLESLHFSSMVIDLHNDVMEKVVTGYELGTKHNYEDSDIPRFREGGIDIQFFALWIEQTQPNPFQLTEEMITSFRGEMAKNSAFIAQAATPEEALRINSEGKIAGVLGAEGGHAIENNLEKLRELYRQGVRYLTITWNNSTSWATSALDPQSMTKGLSDFGRQVVWTLDSLGMIIDVSHVGPKTIEDILQVTRNPIIASHSGVKALRNHYRNLSDSQIVKIARSGGVVGVVFHSSFLSNSNRASVDTVIKHIDYITRLVGVDYVALGSDFDGGIQPPIGLEDVSRYPAITDGLLNRGYSNKDIKKILGENFMRVFRRVCSKPTNL